MRFKYKGRIPDTDDLHQVTSALGVEPGPMMVYVPGVGYIPQYAPTVVGGRVCYDPAENCQGYFTSYKFQPHNNCYNYATNIATNTVAQPGRRHGMLMPGNIDPEKCVAGAEQDGLILAGGPGTTLDDLRQKSTSLGAGHFAALLIAPPDAAAGFPGDYHWVRCDDLEHFQWSQKDGPDQITNFDFAGTPIRDPLAANWSVNSGSLNNSKPAQPDFFVTYTFRAFLFVPYGRVDII